MYIVHSSYTMLGYEINVMTQALNVTENERI